MFFYSLRPAVHRHTDKVGNLSNYSDILGKINALATMPNILFNYLYFPFFVEIRI